MTWKELPHTIKLGQLWANLNGADDGKCAWAVADLEQKEADGDLVLGPDWVDIKCHDLVTRRLSYSNGEWSYQVLDFAGYVGVFFQP